MKNKFTQKAAALLCSKKSTQSRPHCAPTAVHDGNHRLPCCCTGICR